SNLADPDEAPVKLIVVHHEMDLTAISPHGVYLEGSGPAAPGIGGVRAQFALPYPILMMLSAIVMIHVPGLQHLRV
ncbi:MAG: hypothetical protein Q613_PSC00151G0002, partial [Propionibacterium sp. DORA_15]